MQKQQIIGKTLARLRKLAKLTQPDVADATGIDQPKISRIENGKLPATIEELTSFAKLYGLRLSEFMALIEDETAVNEPLATYTPRVLEGISMVPLIGWVQAGKWTDSDAPIAADEIQTWVPTQAKVSRKAYALEIEGESMINPKGEPSFPPRTRIIVDPLVPAGSGKLVIAQIDDEPQSTFKKLVIEGNAHYLVPLNPQFDTLRIDRPTRICGVVIAKAEHQITQG